jgi:hypothetical protein
VRTWHGVEITPRATRQYTTNHALCHTRSSAHANTHTRTHARTRTYSLTAQDPSSSAHAVQTVTSEVLLAPHDVATNVLTGQSRHARQTTPSVVPVPSHALRVKP